MGHLVALLLCIALALASSVTPLLAVGGILCIGLVYIYIYGRNA